MAFPSLNSLTDNGALISCVWLSDDYGIRRGEGVAQVKDFAFIDIGEPGNVWLKVTQNNGIVTMHPVSAIVAITLHKPESDK